jgi:pyruvate dehydrogenase E2 component (dihydrolipoamide acetyltransferase)
MLKKVILGQLSLTMEKGTVVRWYKREGEPVGKGELLYALETDKATQDIEAFDSGFLTKILVREGEEVPVNTIIGYIGDAAEELPEAQASGGGGPASGAAPQPHPAPSIEAGRAGSIARRPSARNATPLAKKVARQRGVDLSGLAGTGPGGIIVQKDVLRAPAGKGEADPRVGTVRILARERLTSVRKITAGRVRRSWSEAPHFFLELTVDMTSVQTTRGSAGYAGATYTDFLLFAAGRALRRHPRLNSTLAGEEVIIFGEVNVGFAATTERGLLVPVIRGADILSLQEISAQRKHLLERVQAGAVGAEDLAGGTFTVTNLGMYGIEIFQPVLNLGQTAILAAGKVMNMPVAEDSGNIVVRPVIKLTLACDHRVIDGAEAAPFLTAFQELLEFFHE